MRGVLRAMLALGMLTPAGAAPPQGQAAPAEATPARRRPGLRASVEPVLDRLQAEAIEAGIEVDPSNPFRFSTMVEVRTRSPEQLLARLLDGPEQRLARAPDSPPSLREMDEQRVLGPQPDLVGLTREVARWFGSRGEPHYFLYRVTREGEVSAVLRETRLPAALLTASRSGAVFEPVGEFASREDALQAYTRLRADLARDREAAEAALEVPPR